MVKRAGGSLLLSLRVDRESPQSFTTQLCVQLRELILGGALAAGERMPATRTLAADLGVSRTTIVEVFERLAAEGLIESLIGSGTFVSAALKAERPRPPTAVRASAKARSANGEALRLSDVMRGAIARFGERRRLPHMPRAFTTALPAFDAFPMAQWARLSAKYLRGGRNEIMGYGDPDGSPHLRRAIAAHLRANRGIACDPEQLFIVAGAQQAFHLIGATLLNPGDKVWFENPGAIGARNSLIATGAELVSVPVDRDGLCVDEGLRLSPRFRLAFVTPSHQQPLGSVMSLERRFALLNAVARAGAWVIEDDYDGEFFFGGRPPPALKSVDTTDLVIHVGTFSKSLFPSLRLGYLLAPPALVDTFRAIMGKYLQGVPSHTQAVVAEFIDEGHFSAHVRRMRHIYEERHAALLAAARKRLAGLLTVEPTHGGLHTIARLHTAHTETEVAAEADRRAITVSPIGRFAIAPSKERGLVLGFGGVTPRQIAAGVDVLADILARPRGRAAAAPTARAASPA